MTSTDNFSSASSSAEPLSFGVTWDYRCPFARNAHEHLIAALEDGAELDVTFIPFSLTQMHVEDGGVSAFDDPSKSQDLLAIQVGLVVRDRLPERFLSVHNALFALRHDEGRDLREEGELRSTLAGVGVDADFVFGEIAKGWPLETFRNEHEAAERAHSVWGVPTFIVGADAAFVRIMTRPDGDAKEARRTIEHVVGMFRELPEVNEFKHTSIPN